MIDPVAFRLQHLDRRHDRSGFDCGVTIRPRADAREESLVAFYERYGFRRAISEDHPRRLYLKMTEIRAMEIRPFSLTA